MVMGMILDIKTYFATGEAVYAKDIEAKNRALARLLDYILEYRIGSYKNIVINVFRVGKVRKLLFEPCFGLSWVV